MIEVTVRVKATDPIVPTLIQAFETGRTLTIEQKWEDDGETTTASGMTVVACRRYGDEVEFECRA